MKQIEAMNQYWMHMWEFFCSVCSSLGMSTSSASASIAWDPFPNVANVSVSVPISRWAFSSVRSFLILVSSVWTEMRKKVCV